MEIIEWNRGFTWHASAQDGTRIEKHSTVQEIADELEAAFNCEWAYSVDNAAFLHESTGVRVRVEAGGFSASMRGRYDTRGEGSSPVAAVRDFARKSSELVDAFALVASAFGASGTES